jgi:glutamine amidotransferase
MWRIKMCLLMVASPNYTPTRQELMCACTNNPDGFGYAIHVGDRILTGKGLNAEHMVSKFLKVRAQYPDAWAMFHARWATHGSVCSTNSHPYEVGGRQDIILGHNGVLGVEIPAGDDRSDTLVFAEDWLPNFLELLDCEAGFGELEELVSGSKIAIFSTAPELQNQVYILNEDLGHWVGGLWWSNYSYQVHNTWSRGFKDYYSSWDYVKDDDYQTDYCYNCEMYEPHPLVDFVCATCGACLDCLTYLDDCLCYRPDLHQESLFGGEY